MDNNISTRIEPPLSPVLSGRNSARRKARQKLLNKYSQSVLTPNVTTQISELKNSESELAVLDTKTNQTESKTSELPIQNYENSEAMNTKFDVNFKTGSGKKIYLSDKTVQRASKMFDDIIQTPFNTINKNFDSKKFYSNDFKENISTTNAQINDSRSDFKQMYNETIGLKQLPNKTKENSCVAFAQIHNTRNNIQRSLKNADKKFENVHNSENIPVANINDDQINTNQDLLEQMCNETNELNNTKRRSKVSFTKRDFSQNITQAALITADKNSDNIFYNDVSNETFLAPMIITDKKIAKTSDEIPNVQQYCKQMSNEPKDNNNAAFTQISDTQICLVAEEAECICNFVDVRWSQSPQKKLQKNNIKEFEDFLTQETEFCFGNIISPETRLEIDFIGFNKDDCKNSIRIINLYKQLIQNVGDTSYVNKIKREPSFANLRYSLRSSNKLRIINTLVSHKRKRTASRGKTKKDRTKLKKPNESVLTLNSSQINENEQSKVVSLCSTISELPKDASDKCKFSNSKNALKKAKNIFDSCNKVPTNTPIINQIIKEQKNNIDTFEINKNKKMKNSFSENVVIESELSSVRKCDSGTEISKHVLNNEKNIMEDNSCVENSRKKFPGFSTVSGRKIHISEDNLRKVQNLFSEEKQPANNFQQNEEFASRNTFDDFESLNESNQIKEMCGFKTATGKKIHISENALRKCREIFDNCETVTESSKLSEGGFITGIEQNINMTENGFNKWESPRKLPNFSTASGRKIHILNDNLGKVGSDSDQNELNEEFSPGNIFDNGNNQINEMCGFKTATGKKINVSEDNLQKCRKIFDNCDTLPEFEKLLEPNPKRGFTTGKINNLHKTFGKFVSPNKAPEQMKFGFIAATGREESISKDALDQVRNMTQSEEIRTPTNRAVTILNNDLEISKVALDQVRDATQSEKIRTPKNITILSNNDLQTEVLLSGSKHDTTPVLRANSRRKRSLGLSSCRQINISASSLKRAKLIFEEAESPQPKVGLTYPSPISFQIKNKNFTSTPIIKEKPNATNESRFTEKIISPVPENKICNRSFKVENVINGNSQICFQKVSNTDLKTEISNVQNDLERAKLKIVVMETRLRALNEQEKILTHPSLEHLRQRPGYLYLKKTGNSKRISLKEAVNCNSNTSNFKMSCNKNINSALFAITAENSAKIHFHVPWWPNEHQTFPAVIHTNDGAIVIPNQKSYVGLSEIAFAFRAMPGIDSKLIPNKWIDNHFKWIVWKLARLQRNFPDVFGDCMSVENVVAQLKYRYDREIDRSERSALKKILEKDDTPSKRMVLCVASVIKLSEDNYELELTDGWYSIRTTLDNPLNNLVIKGSIKPGVKLITQAAELLSCEACCPLEVPNSVRLRIHYNSTRRVPWDTRLGYQRNPNPLCISLQTIYGSGGPVGCTHAYIARIYPITYMERNENGSSGVYVWRNERADYRRGYHWDAAQAQVIEKIQIGIKRELEEKWALERMELEENCGTELNGITCAKTLLEMIESSNDPQALREKLTAFQCALVQNYQIELNAKRQAELSARLQQQLKSTNMFGRNVLPVIKLLLVDVNNTKESKLLNIWKPTETHLNDLKEGSVVWCYWLTTRSSGSLSTTSRTTFTTDSAFDLNRFTHINRIITPISEILHAESVLMFREFDTIGMVVSVEILESIQNLWLADEHSRFLLITTRESPETCSLFDGLSPGKVIAILNVVYQKPSSVYSKGLANICTLISNYPKQVQAQRFMKNFIENLPNDIDDYLKKCQIIVEEFNSLKNPRFNASNTLYHDMKNLENDLCGVESKEENLTLSDEELLLINTQQFH